MFDGNGGILTNITGAILFPLLFQGAFIDFAWGAGDEFWVMIGKRVFLLMPVLSIVLGCWISIACAITVPFRQNRNDYMTNLLITWWDLGKSIVTFWGGVLKFMVNLFVTGFWLLKFAILGVWSILHELVFMPLRALRNAGHVVMTSNIPWIAVNLTIFWCLIEAFIFTYVTTPLVLDTFSNITGEQLSMQMVRIPLFIFLFFMILGSYAVLSTFVSSVKSKKVSSMLGIGVIEVVVLFVEVVFLYREFVDSLVPWFAQYSENFELGIFGTLAISSFVWFGIRSLSWFLFAEHGTPTIMAVIQGRRMESAPHTAAQNKPFSSVSFEFLEKMKTEAVWFQQKGEEFLNSFMLPPMQVIAACINFCTMLLSSRHLFELPFSSMSSITNSSSLLKGAAPRLGRKSSGGPASPQAPTKPAAAPRGMTRETVYPTSQAPSPAPGPSGAPSGAPANGPEKTQGEYRNA